MSFKLVDKCLDYKEILKSFKDKYVLFYDTVYVGSRIVSTNVYAVGDEEDYMSMVGNFIERYGYNKKFSIELIKRKLTLI